MKLGEALVSVDLITPEQLKEALSRQVMFGGRIGTNLVELGFITEDDIVQFFSKYFKTPAVKPSALEDIAPEVIASLDAKFAEKYYMVPFRKERSRLHVAMLEPQTFDRLEEFRFMIGLDIVPYVMSELRLLYCLEKYYGIKRDLRFISVYDKISGAGAEIEKRAWQKEAVNVAEHFAVVRDRDQVIDILLNEATRVAARAAVFELHGSMVSGWKGRGITVEGFEDTLRDSSICEEVHRNKTLFRGKIPETPANAKLIDILHGVPQESCMLPIRFRDRDIGLLYVDNGNEKVLDAGLAYISTLVAMAEVSFEFILMRKKLYSVISLPQE
ncbi:MAG: hypothetical protein EPN25_09150 [Nitrospirae bacterium]|nr:MAG: hypothetical protein EPN25_09150 [Nitrospirota bacterium]